MPVFWFLVILFAFLLWLLCSFLYKPLGRFVKRLIDDAKKEMEDDEK